MRFPILSGYYFKCKQNQWKITNFHCVDFKRGILINSLISFFSYCSHQKVTEYIFIASKLPYHYIIILLHFYLNPDPHPHHLTITTLAQYLIK